MGSRRRAGSVAGFGCPFAFGAAIAPADPPRGLSVHRRSVRASGSDL